MKVNLRCDSAEQRRLSQQTWGFTTGTLFLRVNLCNHSVIECFTATSEAIFLLDAAARDGNSYRQMLASCSGLWLVVCPTTPPVNVILKAGSSGTSTHIYTHMHANQPTWVYRRLGWPSTQVSSVISVFGSFPSVPSPRQWSTSLWMKSRCTTSPWVLLCCWSLH